MRGQREVGGAGGAGKDVREGGGLHYFCGVAMMKEDGRGVTRICHVRHPTIYWYFCIENTRYPKMASARLHV